METFEKNFKKRYNAKFGIAVGSGTDALLISLMALELKKNDEVIVPEFSFIIYRIYSKIYGAKIKYAKEKNFKISINNILSKVTKKTKIVFLANPNNPTGTFISKKELLKLRKKLRSNILLVVDDAYFEYVNDKNYLSGMKLFSNSKNVIVTRTFSKIYGLAGLRVGWGYGPKNLIYTLNQVKPPFNINRAALFAAVESVRDVKWLNKEISHVNRWTKIFYNNFKSLGIETNFSHGNFLPVNFNKVKLNAKKIFTKLAKNGKWSTPAPVSGDPKLGVNTKYAEGGPSMNAKMNTLYFTRCKNTDGKLKKEKSCQIYKSSKRGQDYAEAQLVVGNDSMVVAHPTLANKDQTLYFVSNMPGGMGGNDIWVADYDKKEKKWDNKQNFRQRKRSKDSQCKLIE